jgi:hypothetical protein
MSDYTKSTNFATKDNLSSGNALKIVKGTEIDTEFNNIATAIATKADLTSPTFTGTPTLPTGTIAVTQSSGSNTTTIATTAFVQAAIALLYPVGSIYTNASVSTNPGTLLGFGTWTAFGAGRVMVGFDSSNALFDSAEETGGSADSILKSHTHTDSGHQHFVANTDTTAGSNLSSSNQLANTYSSATVSNYVLQGTTTSATTGLTSSSTAVISTEGVSATNTNYQPYITVYMWKRTA